MKCKISTGTPKPPSAIANPSEVSAWVDDMDVLFDRADQSFVHGDYKVAAKAYGILIFDPEPDLVVIAAATEEDASAGMAEFDRVVQEIADQAVELGGVAAEKARGEKNRPIATLFVP